MEAKRQVGGMKRYKVEAWFLRTLAASHTDRVKVTPEAVVEAASPEQAREVYAARYQIPVKYHRLPGAQIQGDLKPRRATHGLGSEYHRRKDIPVVVMRVEEARR